ncbi:cysteine hydrolase [Aeromonas dhakensis]|nr:isochorismatase family protein [Aeromonas dhakensis]USP11121.1 cysteine hydrolase [Aeromonas dhakensis]
MNKALLVIDFINDIAHPDGRIAASAAREGHDRDYAITILEDACAAADANEHHASLRLLGRIAEIIKVAQLA